MDWHTIPDPEQPRFPERLKRWREAQDPRLSQPALARVLGLHPQTIAWWEQGRRSPGEDGAARLRALREAGPGAVPATAAQVAVSKALKNFS